MPKYFILLFYFFCSNAIAQTLKFDVVASYSIKNSKFTDTSTVFGVSTNSNYFMRITNNPNGSQSALVYDISLLKQYHYNIKPVASEIGETVFNFEYIDQRNFKRSKNGKYDFEFKSVSTTDSIENVKLKCLSDINNRKETKKYDLQIKKSDVNYFYLFRAACMHALEFLPNFNYENPGIVTSCVSEKNSSVFNLITFEDANLSVTIPSN